MACPESSQDLAQVVSDAPPMPHYCPSTKLVITRQQGDYYATSPPVLDQGTVQHGDAFENMLKDSTSHNSGYAGKSCQVELSWWHVWKHGELKMNTSEVFGDWLARPMKSQPMKWRNPFESLRIHLIHQSVHEYHKDINFCELQMHLA